MGRQILYDHIKLDITNLPSLFVSS